MINSKNVGIFVVFILIFSLLSMFFVGGNVAIQGVKNEVMELSGLRYTTHDPIIIDSDANFTAANGVSGGDGTQANPYIISGYEIDAKGGDYGISISNTNSYFMIEDCYIYNTSSFSWFTVSAGISFYNMTNGSIVNTVIMDGEYGIVAEDSGNLVIKNSTVSNTSRDGIYFNNVNDSLMGNNTLWDNYQGIYLIDSHNTIFYSNKLTNASIMLGGDRDTFTTQTIYTNNTVNGKPVYYYNNANMNNASVPSDAGEVLVGNVSYLKVENLIIEQVDIAMEITYSEYISVQNNTISNNIYGIFCYKADNIIIANNTMKNQTKYGLVMDTLNYTEVLNNRLVGNGWYGLQIYAVFNSSIEDNIFAENGYTGVYGDAGLYMLYSKYNYVENNSVSNNTHGVELYESHYNFIANNTVLNNSKYGMALSSSSTNYVDNNSIEHNEGDGLYLKDSTYNKINSNRMVENGIVLDGSLDTFTTQMMDNNTANSKPIYYYKNINAGNSVVPADAGQVIVGKVSYLYIKNLNIEKVDVGIEVGYSNHIYIENNTVSDNRDSGIWFYYTENITVKDNRISGNRYGMYIEYSDYNSIANNTIESSKSFGAYIYRSYSNTLSGNTIKENGWDGILLSSSDYNTITNNELSNNTGYGIYINAYSNNLVYENKFYFNNGSNDTYNASHVQAYDRGSNIWNTTDKGNYWHDWANNNDTNDQDGDGIVDWAYKLDGGAVDYYPLTNATPIPELSMLVLVVLVLFAALLLRKRA